MIHDIDQTLVWQKTLDKKIYIFITKKEIYPDWACNCLFFVNPNYPNHPNHHNHPNSTRVAGIARQARSVSRTTATTRTLIQYYNAKIHSVGKAIIYTVFNVCDVQDTSRELSTKSGKGSFACHSYGFV